MTAANDFLRRAGAAALAACAALSACKHEPTQEDIEALRNTYACKLAGERLVVRFDSGDARLLMPDGERVTLYQIPAESGFRFSNGRLELRGKSRTDMQLLRDGTPLALEGCDNYTPPPQQ
jgi:membrane-bound inhibitor of C-type lysozyme